MHIILTIILFYVHLILHLVPYMFSGVAVACYFFYKEEQAYRAAVASFAEQFGVTKEEAEAMITRAPIVY